MTTSLRARAGFTGALALACAGLTGIAAPAHAATPDSANAAHFLTSQLAASGHHFESSGYADYGLTIDAVLGLDSAQSGQTEATAAAADVAKNVTTYQGDGTSELYAGATAKLLVLTEAQGGSITRYLDQLKGLEADNGQFKDKSQYGDYSNTIGQAMAVIGLARAHQSDAKAAAFLADQQCADGGFRIKLSGDCAGDTDATSMAVQALSAAGGHDAEITKAVNFIAGQQQADGGVVEPAAQAAPNTNSTGLAAVAFALAGRTSQAAKAKAFVNSLQFGCDVPAALRGAYAYDKASFDAQVAKGSSATPTDKERRAGTQALLAITQQPYLKISAGGSATAPALSCASSSPTSSTTSSSTTTATSTTSVTTGPPVVTDGPSSGGNDGVLLAGFAALGGAALAGAGLRRRLRSDR